MKKIPTLYTRIFENHRIVGIKPEIKVGCEEALLHGVATIKLDGACCAIINGVFYKRYDAKKGRKAPEGAIPCGSPDSVTGHHPHWVRVSNNDPSDKWFCEAFYHAENLHDGTYEAIGPHFNGNPYGLKEDVLMPHGKAVIYVERDFEHIRDFLWENAIEGIVFWLNGEPACKIKRTDFGFPWPV